MPNLKLYDGTVRCADCMDASTYEDETNEMCSYCGHIPHISLTGEE